ncbi:toll/interleukin-1 receptor domain-containing protein [Micromonospora maritima]|uniref:toll/interleukin-1 receptor domain-containing protein n=1 Tax=Micromonospora maritima TaxID=986711 RepID=UPI00378AA097
MRIFISWSGEPSRSIARAIRDWLRVVVQHSDPWMSDQEITSGARWNDLLAEALEQSDFGLVCVTRKNQSAPWLMFESGALAKHLKTARLVPLCIDLAPSEITSPLQSFQARTLDREGIYRLVQDLSALAKQPVPRESVDMLFEAMWPKLEPKIAAANNSEGSPERPKRSTEDMLVELVTRMRDIERSLESERKGIDTHDIAHLADIATVLNEASRRMSHLEDTAYILNRAADTLTRYRGEGDALSG